jgi:pimeloyl-ACP methyl ester carboxylesterase
MHGSGLDHTYFGPAAERFSSKYRVVLYDHRQNGRSPRAPYDVVDLDRMADDAAAVAQATANGQVVVIAHSFGPWVALRAAMRPDTFVKGLILVSPGLTPSVGSVLMNYVVAHGTTTQQQLLAEALAGQVTGDERLADAYRSVLPLYFAASGEQLTSWIMSRAVVSALGFNQFLTGCFATFDALQALRSVTVPCLVIAGEHDWLETDPDTSGRTVADAAQTGSLAVIRDCGHFPFVEEPEAFEHAVRAWLVRQGLARVERQ